MIDMLKRHEIQVLRRAGHTWMEVAALSGVSVRTARRVAEEAAVVTPTVERTTGGDGIVRNAIDVPRGLDITHKRCTGQGDGLSRRARNRRRA